MLKIGDRVKIRGIEGIHVVEASGSTYYPIKVNGCEYTKYGQLFNEDGEVLLTLVEEPFEFRAGDVVRIKDDSELSVGVLRPHNKPDSDLYPFMVFGKTFSKQGELFTGEGPAIELVERSEPQSESKEFTFELHDKVAIKGYAEHFILHPNDLNDSEDYPFKAVSPDGESFGVTRDGKTDISVDITLIDRPNKIAFTELINGVSVMNLKDYKLRYKSDLLCEKVKRVEVTSVLHPLDSTKVSEAQLEAFTKGTEIDVNDPLMVSVTDRMFEKAKVEYFTKLDAEIAKSSEFNLRLRENIERLDDNLPVRCQVVEGGTLPTYAHDGDAGMDLYVREVEIIELEGGSISKYHLGIKLDLDEGYAAFIYPRSSAYKTQHLMTNSVGVVDSGYKGEISAVMACRTPYEVGDRACQMVIMPVPKVKLIEVEELRDSSRGSNGYGSTGK